LTIPVAELRTLAVSDSPAAVLEATVDTGFSRFPVQDVDGRAVGYLHVRDVLGVPSDTGMTLAGLALRPLPAVAQSASAASVAEILRTQGVHLARVVDLSGSDVGLIALEDVLEELIGEVRDTAHR
jgi:CBS domain containing-hemolysin-like protein